jgi:hypothetical protein
MVAGIKVCPNCNAAVGDWRERCSCDYDFAARAVVPQPKAELAGKLCPTCKKTVDKSVRRCLCGFDFSTAPELASSAERKGCPACRNMVNGAVLRCWCGYDFTKHVGAVLRVDRGTPAATKKQPEIESKPVPSSKAAAPAIASTITETMAGPAVRNAPPRQQPFAARNTMDEPTRPTPWYRGFLGFLTAVFIGSIVAQTGLGWWGPLIFIVLWFILRNLERREMAEVEERTGLDTWEDDGDDVTTTLHFPTMRLVRRWSSDGSSARYVFEHYVRRVGPNQWEMKVTAESQAAMIAVAEKDMPGSFFVEELKRDECTWKPVSEEFAPSIETAYQRYIARG